MNIPDLAGMRLDIVKDTIKNQYPEINLSVVFYQSPRKRKSLSLPDTPIERVVRQRVLSDLELELTISVFYENPGV